MTALNAVKGEERRAELFEQPIQVADRVPAHSERSFEEVVHPLAPPGEELGVS